MKLSVFLLALASSSCAYAAENFAPTLPANSTCKGNYAIMYNQCRTNALSVACLPTDDLCNCRQAQNLAQCITYCSMDPYVFDNLPSQEVVVSKWCSGIPLSILNPPSATSSPSSVPTSSPSSTQVGSILDSGSSSSAKMTGLSILAVGMMMLIV
ncbi:hypothetical protein K493DRAFT_100357 [Basidiobolus meristosporus CBS 931.73]|uniref:Extracellular membrane protein CFEM domain-containing protein n=1 Tax=Basidiobolus meristosporus CBS 931.73 TaxID=1314790 RepID=A0A1Y1X1D1_9FUNG|nr:hypothetical protein K493DRAFT_100357 [Basidiobolus meristosporus CBS 931.73]|eukprot:ORX79465.1 hypothetical protein K493DRAFT_100357 [Basidiobolus meristosporus CBS 931.73]